MVIVMVVVLILMMTMGCGCGRHWDDDASGNLYVHYDVGDAGVGNDKYAT